MKKLIILLTLISVSFTGDFFKGMENPNGKPFTLSIGTSIIHYSYSEYGDSQNSATNTTIFTNGIGKHNEGDKRLQIYFSMPISNVLTMSGNYYSTIYSENYTRLTQNSSLRLTCHLPLYKLWEN